MDHDSGQPEDLAASEDLPADDAWEHPEDVAGQAEVTGVARVDEVIAGLDGLSGRPLDEHVAVFEDAHAKLRQVLSDLDDGPADS